MHGPSHPFALVQIEPTSRCNLACRTCPRGSHPLHWQERDLDASLLTSLLRSLPTGTVLHLQGWGEPLLHPDIFHFISQIQQAGHRVSLTSNGTVTDKKITEKLVDNGPDSLTFSMAGFSSRTQDPLRGPGTREQLEHTVDWLNKRKKQSRGSGPVLAISYLFTPASVTELPATVTWCAQQNVSLLAGIHLTHPLDDVQKSLQCFPLRDRDGQRSIRKAELKAIFHRLHLQFPAMKPEKVPVCAKNPLDCFFVAADGSVAPCVFLASPYAGSASPLARQVFGNLHRESIGTIWNRSGYRKFRHPFAQRTGFYNRIMARVGFDLDALDRLEKANELVGDFFNAHPPPAPCRGCLKMQGA